MRIQADTREELDEAIEVHRANGWKLIVSGRAFAGEWYAEFVSADPINGRPEHPAISIAAVELRKLGVSYATAKPILRRVFNAGKGAGA